MEMAKDHMDKIPLTRKVIAQHLSTTTGHFNLFSQRGLCPICSHSPRHSAAHRKLLVGIPMSPAAQAAGSNAGFRERQNKVQILVSPALSLRFLIS